MDCAQASTNIAQTPQIQSYLCRILCELNNSILSVVSVLVHARKVTESREHRIYILPGMNSVDTEYECFHDQLLAELQARQERQNVVYVNPR